MQCPLETFLLGTGTGEAAECEEFDFSVELEQLEGCRRGGRRGLVVADSRNGLESCVSGASSAVVVVVPTCAISVSVFSEFFGSCCSCTNFDCQNSCPRRASEPS